MKKITNNDVFFAFVCFCAMSVYPSHTLRANFFTKLFSGNKSSNSQKSTPTPIVTNTSNNAALPAPLNQTINSCPIKGGDLVNEDKWVSLRLQFLPTSQSKEPERWKKEFATALNSIIKTSQEKAAVIIKPLTLDAITTVNSDLKKMSDEISKELSTMFAIINAKKEIFNQKIESLNKKMLNIDTFLINYAKNVQKAQLEIPNQIQDVIKKGGLTVDEIIKSNATSVKASDIGLSSS